MVTVRSGLRKVKDDYQHFIPAEAILLACRRHGYAFRQRLLGPAETIYLFLIQVLHGNAACSSLRHLAGMACSVTAYGKARMRIPVAVFRTLLRWVCQAPPRWPHRTPRGQTTTQAILTHDRTPANPP